MNVLKIAFGLISLLIVYLLLQPFICSNIFLLNPNTNHDHETLKSYFVAVGTIATISLSILGLILGYMYFQSRKEFDETVIEKQRERSCAQLLLGYLDEYDSCLDVILKQNFTDERHLERLRAQFEDIWDKLLGLLESDFAKNIFRKDEQVIILEIHSYINKQEIICNDSEATVRSQKMTDTAREYKSRYRLGRRICISRTV